MERAGKILSEAKEQDVMARPERFELPAFWFVVETDQQEHTTPTI